MSKPGHYLLSKNEFTCIVFVQIVFHSDTYEKLYNTFLSCIGITMLSNKSFIKKLCCIECS